MKVWLKVDFWYVEYKGEGVQIQPRCYIDFIFILYIILLRMWSQINDILYPKGAKASKLWKLIWPWRKHFRNKLHYTFFLAHKKYHLWGHLKSNLSFTISVLDKVLGFTLQAVYKLIGGINGSFLRSHIIFHNCWTTLKLWFNLKIPTI